MDDYLPLVVTFVLAVVFVLGSIVTSRQLLGPRRPTSAKEAPYECGIVPSTEPPERFPVRFYLVAMIFIIFDIEIIFLFPWATVFRGLGGYGLGVMAAFIVPFFLSFVWEISQGGLDWGPVPAGASASTAVSARAHRHDHRPPRRPRGPRSRVGRPDAPRCDRRRHGLAGLQHNFLTGSLEDVVKWARRNSVWPATFGLACCAIEMMATGAAHYDLRPASAWRSSGPRPARPTS